jgi:hypothetical protein
MTTRYWVIGGEYQDPEFRALVPGTETMAGPVRERAESQDGMDPPHLLPGAQPLCHGPLLDRERNGALN